MSAGGQEPNVRYRVNVSDGERGLTLLLGGTLLVRAAVRPSAWSPLLGLAAGILAVRALRGHCPLYRALGLRSADELGDQPDGTTSAGALVVEKSATIQRRRNEVYQFWRNLENLPQFMTHVQAVHVASDGTSHWTVRGPAGSQVRWEAKITEDIPDERLAWVTREGASVRHEGIACFADAPGARGTEVRVRLCYHAKGGKFGALLARVLGQEPSQQILEDLRRLKQIMETGEVPTAARRRS